MHSKQDIIEIFSRINEKAGPIELDHVNPYTLLVAVILSARATDKGVNKATKDLFKVVQTPEQMLELGVEGLENYVKTIGLYKNKAANIIKMSKVLIEKHNSQVPKTRDELEELAGVGRKTANVVLNELYDLPTFPVDTHVFRVCNRLGLTNSKNPLQTEAVLEKIVPEEYRVDAAHSLVLHGRYVCIARKPKCDQCSVRQWCDYAKNIINDVE